MVVLRETKYQKEYLDKKGVHVIVGQYTGIQNPWDPSPDNLTDGTDYWFNRSWNLINYLFNIVELLNSNFYAPMPRAGENGLPVYVGQSESARMKVLYHVNRFNILASDRISVNRSLPDPRKQR